MFRILIPNLVSKVLIRLVELNLQSTRTKKRGRLLFTFPYPSPKGMGKGMGWFFMGKENASNLVDHQCALAWEPCCVFDWRMLGSKSNVCIFSVASMLDKKWNKTSNRKYISYRKKWADIAQESNAYNKVAQCWHIIGITYQCISI
jgi:hypothetical protein